MTVSNYTLSGQINSIARNEPIISEPKFILGKYLARHLVGCLGKKSLLARILNSRSFTQKLVVTEACDGSARVGDRALFRSIPVCMEVSLVAGSPINLFPFKFVATIQQC